MKLHSRVRIHVYYVPVYLYLYMCVLKASPIGSLKPIMESKHTKKPHRQPLNLLFFFFFYRFATVALLNRRARTIAITVATSNVFHS